MLARVAENMYWMARYIERAEDMARLINVNTNLLLDLPPGIAPGWRPLVTIIGADEAFEEKHEGAADEARVLRFLLADKDNPQSIVSTLQFARENARTFRDAIPREAWEEINSLYLYARDNVQGGLSKRGRFEYLSIIIRRCQTLTGLLAGCMNQDEAYSFIQIGRKVERADMITRILDVRTTGLLSDEGDELRPFENILWVSVLRSLTGYQMYRLKMQVRVRRSRVLEFLLKSEHFPRALCYCLNSMSFELEKLGGGEAPLRTVGRLQRMVNEADVAQLDQQHLQDFIDAIQLGLAEIHTALDDTYFLRQSAVQEESAA